MLKVFMNEGDDILIDLQDEAKEIRLVYKFAGGLDSTTVLRLKVGGEIKKIPVAAINNIQFVRKEEKKKPRFGAQERMDLLATKWLKDLINEKD